MRRVGGSKNIDSWVWKHDEPINSKSTALLASDHLLPYRFLCPEIPLYQLALSTDTPSSEVVISVELEILYPLLMRSRKLADNLGF